MHSTCMPFCKAWNVIIIDFFLPSAQEYSHQKDLSLKNTISSAKAIFLSIFLFQDIGLVKKGEVAFYFFRR